MHALSTLGIHSRDFFQCEDFTISLCNQGIIHSCLQTRWIKWLVPLFFIIFVKACVQNTCTLDMIRKSVYTHVGMWLIFEKKSAAKDLKKTPKEVLRRYEVWKRIVEISGPQGLRVIKGFYDESLKGEWKGYRSSRLGIQWRVIYKIEKNVCEVYVFEVNPHKF